MNDREIMRWHAKSFTHIHHFCSLDLNREDWIGAKEYRGKESNELEHLRLPLFPSYDLNQGTETGGPVMDQEQCVNGVRQPFPVWI